MSDYVVTNSRKRRRIAIDPCLGYYLHSKKTRDAPVELEVELPSSIQAELELQRPPEFESDNINTARKTNIPYSSPYTSNISATSVLETGEQGAYIDKVITVEDFLKASGNRNPVKQKQYGKKALRLGALCENNADIATVVEGDEKGYSEPDGDNAIQLRSRIIPRQPSLDDTSGSDFATSSPKYEKSSSSRMLKANPKSRHSHPKRKSLKERLYEAAVMTHGIPDDSFMRADGGNSTRVPLHFIPGVQTLRSPKRQPWTLVDPHRSFTIQTASFLCRGRAHDFVDTALLVNPLDRIPMIKWDLDLEENSPSHRAMLEKPSRRHKNRRSGYIFPEIDDSYLPLSFVPLEVSEKGYKVLFSCPRKKARHATPGMPSLQMKAVDLMSTPNCSSPMIPNVETQQAAANRISAPPSIIREIITNSLDLANHVGEVDAVNPANKPINSLFGHTPVPIHTESAASRRSIGSHNLLNETPQKHGKIPTKSLRPLGSFMDEFYENILNVNGAGSKPALRLPKNNRRKSSRECLPHCRPCSDPEDNSQSSLSSMKSKRSSFS